MSTHGLSKDVPEALKQQEVNALLLEGCGGFSLDEGQTPAAVPTRDSREAFSLMRMPSYSLTVRTHLFHHYSAGGALVFRPLCTRDLASSLCTG